MGAQRIRNIGAALLAMLGQGGSGLTTFAGSLVTSIDGAGLPTFPGDSKVGADPTAALSIPTKQYVDAKTPYLVTVGGDAYTGTFPDIPNLVTGQYIQVKINQANTTTSPTFNLNSTGAVPIVTVIGASPAIGVLAVGGTYLMVYDGGTNTWVLTSLGNPTTGTFPLSANANANAFQINDLAVGSAIGDALSALNFFGVANQPGYVKIPLASVTSPASTPLTTLIFQWGTVAPTSVSAGSFNPVPTVFPTNFTSSVFTVLLGVIADNNGGAHGAVVSAQSGTVSTSGFTLQVGNGAANPFSIGAYWLAIGI